MDNTFRKKGSIRRSCVLLCMFMVVLTLMGCECEHSYGNYEVKISATCSEVGIEERVCSECGESESREIPMLEHTYGEWVNTKEATCIEKGTQTATCTVCGATRTRETELGSHTYDEWKTTEEATCTATGTKSHSCTICGVEETDNISATGHSYSESLVQKVSCTRNGITKYTCLKCGDYYDENITASGHNWNSATCTVAKKCSRCGITEGSALGHNKGSNGKCTRCGEKMTIDMKEVISAPEDTWSHFRDVDSFGKVKLWWLATSFSVKTIKYYTVTFYYYNRVGDPAKNNITGETSYTKKYIGPVEPWGKIIVSDIGYCSTCSSVLIGEITLEYTDGTIDTGWYGYTINMDAPPIWIN